nr:MAG TPA: hypothetical protein [Crassvirales sp.]
MRTITVIFTERKVSPNKIPSYKKYKFLCNYDTVSLYDMVEDPRYTGKMMVVEFTRDTDRVQQGITLKDIYITKVNGQVINQPAGLVNGSLAGSDFDIDKQRTDNMEEERNIKVTLKQAIEWYNGDNNTLRALALIAYTEDELKFNFKYINSKVCSTCFCANVPANEAEKYNTLADLAIIAKFFNGSWKKTTSNTGYFLGNYNNGNGPVADICNGVGAYKHNTVQYAGIVYFKNLEDAIKAVKILGNRVKNLFD